VKIAKAYAVCFCLFALIGFFCKYYSINLGNAFGWSYAAGAAVTAIEHEPVSVITKILAVVTGFGVGEWLADRFHPANGLGNLASPRPSPNLQLSPFRNSPPSLDGIRKLQQRLGMTPGDSPVPGTPTPPWRRRLFSSPIPGQQQN